MKVTVTGGTGFVGRRLIESLIDSGHEARILSRSPRTGLPEDVNSYLWDAAKSEPPLESLDGTDAVVHLAGEPVGQRWSPEIRRRIRSSRIEGTRLLVDALRRQSRPPATLVSASAVGYYGSRGDEELTEDSSPGKGFLPEVCDEWEAEAIKAEGLGIRVVRVRIGLVLGAGGGALDRMLPPFKMFLGGQLGDGQQWMPWIHLDDLVGLIRLALKDTTLAGPLNAVSPNPVRNSQFTRVLARTLRRPALFTVPKKGLQILFGDMSEILLGSQLVLPAAAEKAGYRFQHSELAPALLEILG